MTLDVGTIAGIVCVLGFFGFVAWAELRSRRNRRRSKNEEKGRAVLRSDAQKSGPSPPGR